MTQTVPTESVGVMAGLAALAAMFWSVHIVALGIIVVSLSSFDLWTGARRARLRTAAGLPGGFDRNTLDNGIHGKFFYLVATLLLGMTADVVVVLFAGLFDLADALSGTATEFTPLTAVALLWRAHREWQSIRANIEDMPGGQDAIWPGLGVVFDQLRWRLSGGAGPHPQRRAGDDAPPETVARAMRVAREVLDDPPDDPEAGGGDPGNP